VTRDSRESEPRVTLRAVRLLIKLHPRRWVTHGKPFKDEIETLAQTGFLISDIRFLISDN